MKFFKDKFIYILIAVVSILCLVAIAISVNITVIMLQRQDQVAKPTPVKQAKPVYSNVKPVNIRRLGEEKFFFNGVGMEGIHAYVSGKDVFFVPMDIILGSMGVKFNTYSSDDILECSINGERLQMKLGQSVVTLGKEKVELDTAPVVADNRILAPLILFKYIDGFVTGLYSDNETVFLNYYPPHMKYPDSVKMLRLVSGKANISDLGGKKLFWENKDKGTKADSLESSKDGSRYLLKSGKEAYIINPQKSLVPYPVDVGSSASWSLDGRYLYWQSPSTKISYLYDIERKGTVRLGDYHTKGLWDVLYDYKNALSYKRVALADKSFSKNYTYIERNGKTVLEGSMKYSPDGQKVIFYKSGKGDYKKGYYIAWVSGTQITFIGDGKEARWICNDKIFMRMVEGRFVVSRDGSTKRKVGGIWNEVGQTPEGDIFYTGDNDVLYCESGDSQKKLLKLPWECSGLYALSPGGPYVAVSEMANSVVYIKGKEVINICRYEELLSSGSGEYRDRVDTIGISFSQDGKKIAIAFNKDDFVTLKMIDTAALPFTADIPDANGQPIKLMKSMDIVLDYNVGKLSKTYPLDFKWVSDKTLLVYTPKRGWFVDLRKDVRILEWGEKRGNTIQGVIVTST